MRELKGFQKITLAPGESRQVIFRITADDLRFFRADRLAAPEHVFETGEFIIAIGGSSDKLGTKHVVWRCDKR